MEERIKYLFRKFLDNTCTREEFEEVFSYIRMAEKDPAIKAFFEKVYESELVENPAASYVDIEGKLNGLLQPRRKLLRGMPQRKKMIALSAAAAVLLMVTFTWLTQTETVIQKKGTTAEKVVYIIKATDRSELQYLLLPDSTQVWLNAASSLEFPRHFAKDKRAVVLKGEAFFDVKHADKLPFVIYTGDVYTEVLGTAFNIKAYPDMEKITVSVKRGKVKVNYADKKIVLLGVGQEISIAKNNAIKEKKVKENETAAWQDGKLIYDDYTIGDILLDLERVYNISVNVTTPGIREQRVSTSFKREQGMQKALEILTKLTDTNLERENGIYYIK